MSSRGLLGLSTTILSAFAAKSAEDSDSQLVSCSSSTNTVVKNPSNLPCFYSVHSSGIKIIAFQDAVDDTVQFGATVGAGYFNDPPQLEGLAHLTEHMVFLGSKSFSNDDDIDTYLSAHGGKNNAFTEGEATTYFGSMAMSSNSDVNAGLFNRIFDMLLNPTLSADSYEREVQAVNSENVKNQPNQQRMIIEVAQSLLNSQNPVSKFSTGSLETLYNGKNETVPAALQEFHTSNYCTDRMAIAVLSSLEPADQVNIILKAIDSATASTTTSVQSGNSTTIVTVPHTALSCEPWKHVTPSMTPAEANAVYPDPLSNCELCKGSLFEIENKFNWQPTINFVIPLDALNMRQQASWRPQDFLSYLANWAGNGGLRDRLQAKGLIVDLMGEEVGNGGASQFLLSINLTPLGELHPEEVLRELHDHIHIWSVNAASSPQQFIIPFFQQIKAAQDANGGASGVHPDPTNVAINMVLYGDDVENVVSVGQVIDVSAVNATVISDILSDWDTNLIDIANVFVVRSAHVNAETETNIPFSYYAPYSVKYRPVVSLSDLNEYKTPLLTLAEPRTPLAAPTPPSSCTGDSDLDGPAEQKAIRAAANDGADLCEQTITSPPCSVLNIKGLHTYWKGPSGFPAHARAEVRIALRLETSRITPQVATLAQLHADSVERSLSSTLVSNGLDCSSSVNVDYSQGTFVASFSTFSSKVTDVFNLVIDALKVPADDSLFDLAKTALLLDIDDVSDVAPHEFALAELQTIERPLALSIQERRAALIQSPSATTSTDDVTILGDGTVSTTNYASFVNDILPANQIDTLFVGAVTKNAAVSLSQSATKSLQTRSLDDSDCVATAILKPKQPVELREKNPIVGSEDNAIVVSYQWGVPDAGQSAVLEMLGAYVFGPAFDRLRTQLQLGYVVGAGTKRSPPITSLRVLVQGPKASPDDIQVEIENLMTELRTSLEQKYQDDEFIASLAVTAAQKFNPYDPSLSAHADRWWTQILTRQVCFNEDELALRFLTEASNLGELAKDMFEVLTKPSAARRLISVKLFGGDYDPLTGDEPVEASTQPPKFVSLDTIDSASNTTNATNATLSQYLTPGDDVANGVWVSETVIDASQAYIAAQNANFEAAKAPPSNVTDVTAVSTANVTETVTEEESNNADADPVSNSTLSTYQNTNTTSVSVDATGQIVTATPDVSSNTTVYSDGDATISTQETTTTTTTKIPFGGQSIEDLSNNSNSTSVGDITNSTTATTQSTSTGEVAADSYAKSTVALAHNTVSHRMDRTVFASRFNSAGAAASHLLGKADARHPLGAYMNKVTNQPFLTEFDALTKETADSVSQMTNDFSTVNGANSFVSVKEGKAKTAMAAKHALVASTIAAFVASQEKNTELDHQSFTALSHPKFAIASSTNFIQLKGHHHHHQHFHKKNKRRTDELSAAVLEPETNSTAVLSPDEQEVITNVLGGSRLTSAVLESGPELQTIAIFNVTTATRDRLRNVSDVYNEKVVCDIDEITRFYSSSLNEAMAEVISNNTAIAHNEANTTTTTQTAVVSESLKSIKAMHDKAFKQKNSAGQNLVSRVNELKAASQSITNNAGNNSNMNKKTARF